MIILSANWLPCYWIQVHADPGLGPEPDLWVYLHNIDFNEALFHLQGFHAIYNQCLVTLWQCGWSWTMCGKSMHCSLCWEALADY